jgi:hypothetical protein
MRAQHLAARIESLLKGTQQWHTAFYYWMIWFLLLFIFPPANRGQRAPSSGARPASRPQVIQ